MKNGVTFTDDADDPTQLNVNFWADDFLVVIVKLTKPVNLTDALRRANEVAGWTLMQTPMQAPIGKDNTPKVSVCEISQSLEQSLVESAARWKS